MTKSILARIVLSGILVAGQYLPVGANERIGESSLIDHNGRFFG